MKYFKAILIFLVIFLQKTSAQEIKSPSEFLGYELGTRFTYHHKAVEYFKYIADVSPLAEYRSYGETYEGRPLGVCIVSSEENLKDLEELRKNNLIKTGLLKGEFTGKQLPIVWLAYNVHGNESAGMETAMKTLYTLVTGSYEGSGEWIKSCIIVIDPCQNPDGRDLFTTRFNSSSGIAPDPNPEGLEHNQGWPGARSNHYMFDLNRDWTWQTQAETKQRLAFYSQFMPQVHADFHEMGPESTFFFPPGADPWNEIITTWQRDFHKLLGKGNSELFDEKNRLYFTKENYDLFCPSFGDTWPLFNGAIGMTYEQGGGGFSGLAMKLESGDTITLAKRIEGHFLASMATIKVSYENRTKLVSEFNRYFEDGAKNPVFEYKSVIIKGTNEKSSVSDLLRLLDRNQVKYSYASGAGKKYTAFDYRKNTNGEVTIEKGDILVSAFQPQSRMVKVMFEPDSKASDSLSYDLTAWSVPYLYNLQAYAVTEQIRPEDGTVSISTFSKITPSGKPYAYLADFRGFNEIKFMAELYKRQLKLRYMVKPFEANGKKYSRGSIIVARGDNKQAGDNFDELVCSSANASEVKPDQVSGGLADSGKDLGSEYAVLKKQPVIGIMCGQDTQAGEVGELWYYFERELGYPVTLIGSAYWERVNFSKYDVLLLPSGNYSKIDDTLMTYLKKGGRIVAMGSAVSMFAKDKSTALYKAVDTRNTELKDKEKKEKSDDPALLKKFEYELEKRYGLSERSAGSIYKVTLDDTNPYAFGLGSDWFVMKRSTGYPFLASGMNIGYILDKDPVSGFAGNKFREKIKNTIVIGSEKIGSGEVIYITDDPYFRAFWNSGKILLGNVILR